MTIRKSVVTDTYFIPDTTAGVMLVNELLNMNLKVYWTLTDIKKGSNVFKRGTFITSQVPLKVLQHVVRKYAVDIYRSPQNIELSLYKLKRPFIALYVGQGVDGLKSRYKADAEYALELLKFPYTPVDEDDIINGILDSFDVLIIPNGDGYEMLNGWTSKLNWNKEPWQTPGVPKGLGKKGMRAIKRFISNGGGYLGISSGGGALACAEVGGLVDVTMRKLGKEAFLGGKRGGCARVYLKVSCPSSPVTFGFDGYVDYSGKTHEGLFPALYASDPLSHFQPVFMVSENTKVLATYHEIDYEAWTNFLSDPGLLAKRSPAIIEKRIRKGYVILFGVDILYGASWMSTYKLLSNSIYYLTSKRTY